MLTRLNSSFLLSVVICLLTFVSCRHDGYPRVLSEADRLSEVDADSALRLLRPLEQRMTHGPEADEMYWRLLMVKVSDKALNTDCTPAQIERIVNYYKGKGDKQLLPEALYYAGRVYRTCNDALGARRYFLAAIEAIDNSDAPEDFAGLKGKCFSQIGSVYLYQDLCEESVRMYQQAFAINHESSDTTGMIFNLRDVANAYLTMSKPDSSLIYTDKGLTLAGQIRDTLFLNELYLLRSAARIERGEYGRAGADYLKAAMLVDGTPSMAQICIGARLAYATKDTAECRKMGAKMLSNGNLHDKRWAARILSELAVTAGDTEKSMNLIKQYIALDDTVTKLDRAQTILKMNALYDYSRKENENTVLKTQNTRLLTFFWCAIGIMASLAVSIVLYIRYKKQQHALMQLKIERLQALRRENDAKDKETVRKESASVESSEIYREICRMSNSPQGPNPLNDAQWKEIASVIEDTYPGFENRLLSLCRINENEMRVCLLIKMGFAPTLIAALTCHSKESVSATRRRLFEKAFGQKKSPRDWDDFIRTL